MGNYGAKVGMLVKGNGRKRIGACDSAGVFRSVGVTGTYRSMRERLERIHGPSAFLGTNPRTPPSGASNNLKEIPRDQHSDCMRRCLLLLGAFFEHIAVRLQWETSQ
jgi:hypothetical protein